MTHTHSEEHHLYPLVDTFVMGQDMSVSATMTIDHQFVECQISSIEERIRTARLHSARDSEPRTVRRELELLLVELKAVLRLHLRKDEQVYLTVLRHYAGHGIGNEIQLRMQRVYGEGKASTLPTDAAVQWGIEPPPSRQQVAQSEEISEMTEHPHEWLCQQIVDNTGDAVIFGDAEGKVRLWNTGAERIFGFRADEIVEKSMDLIIPENLREREGYDQTMKTGRTQYSRNLLAVPAIRKDGTRISIEFTIALIRNDDGKLLGPAAILREVTARWNQDNERRKRLAALEAEVARLVGPAKSTS